LPKSLRLREALGCGLVELSVAPVPQLSGAIVQRHGEGSWPCFLLLREIDNRPRAPQQPAVRPARLPLHIAPLSWGMEAAIVAACPEITGSADRV